MSHRPIRGWSRNPSDPGWQKLLREAGIPERYWTATPGAITQPTVRAWIDDALHAPEWLATGHGFYIEGPYASGKSSLAAILAMDALRRCERVLWLPTRDVPRVRFNEDDEARAINKRLPLADLVVLDDLGSERFRLATAAGTALEEVARIVYDRSRSLIISSNLSWRKASETYSTAIPAFVSVLERIVTPVVVVNPQWKPPGEGG